MSSIFTKIVNGEIHVIKLPKMKLFGFFRCKSKCKRTYALYSSEIDKIFDMDEAHYLDAFFKKNCYRFRAGGSLQVGMSVIGLEVPHAHVH
jgi:histidine triad (HIT) family protein